MSELRFLKPRRIEDADAELLRWSLVRPADDGSVLLESGAPMTDGRTAYLIWVRIDDSEVEVTLDGKGSPFWRHNGACVGRYDGRFYAHKYDEGGLADAKYAAELVAHEAAK